MEDRTVITVQPAIHQFGVQKGRPVKTIEIVLYDDGTTLHRCVDCDYTHQKFASVFAHRGRKHPNPVNPSESVKSALKVITKATVEAPSPTEIRAMERRIKRLEQRLTDERRARRKAESDLNRIRTALGSKA